MISKISTIWCIILIGLLYCHMVMDGVREGSKIMKGMISNIAIVVLFFVIITSMIYMLATSLEYSEHPVVIVSGDAALDVSSLVTDI